VSLQPAVTPTSFVESAAPRATSSAHFTVGPPERITKCTDVDDLLSSARMKFRHVRKIVHSVMNSPQLKLSQINTSCDSHQVYHFGQSNVAPMTLVEKHSGSGHDSLVPMQVRTRIYDRLMQVAMV
jgi:hypothetical protein